MDRGFTVSKRLGVQQRCTRVWGAGGLGQEELGPPSVPHGLLWFHRKEVKGSWLKTFCKLLGYIYQSSRTRPSLDKVIQLSWACKDEAVPLEKWWPHKAAGPHEAWSKSSSFSLTKLIHRLLSQSPSLCICCKFKWKYKNKRHYPSFHPPSMSLVIFISITSCVPIYNTLLKL